MTSTQVELNVFGRVRAVASRALGVEIAPPPSHAVRLGETEQLKAMSELRTPEETARAEVLNHHGGWGMWQAEARNLRAHLPGLEGWRATIKMNAAIALATGVGYLSKLEHDLPRPFEIDRSLTIVGKVPTGSSYPSNHAAAASAASHVLGVYAPQDASRFAQILDDVSWARTYSNVHLPSDIGAGVKLGAQVAARLR